MPSALSTREEKDAKSSPNVIAYVSVESRNAQDNRPKPRSGQIRKCNLTNFHTVSSLILREVIFLRMNYCIMKGWTVKNSTLMSAFCAQTSINRVHFHVLLFNNGWTDCSLFVGVFVSFYFLLWNNTSELRAFLRKNNGGGRRSVNELVKFYFIWTAYFIFVIREHCN